MLMTGPRTSPWRESVRVLCRRLRVMHWLFAFLAIAVFLSLTLVAQRGVGSSMGTAQMWMIVAGIGLWQYGMVLAVATGDAAQRGFDAVPGARRALWRAAATIGTAAAAAVVAGGLLLGALGAAATPLAVAIASASMALAGGFGLVFLMRARSSGRWLFVLIALLPLSLWRPLATGEQPAMPVTAAWLLLWTLAWPACVVLLAREISAQPAAPGPTKSLRKQWQLLNHRLRRQGFDCTRADPRWLMREASHRFDMNGWLAWLMALAIVLSIQRDLASTFMWLAFFCLFAAAPGLIWMTEGGLRPRLLLLPGGHFRRNLAWTVFREGLRAWLGFACAALLLWAAATLLGYPSSIKGLAIGASFAGLVVLAFGGTIATRAWVAHTGWRVAIQLLAGLGLMLLSVAGAVILDNSAGTDQRMWLFAAFAAAALQAALGVALVAASAKAWTKLDLAQLTRPERPRGPFDPPLLPAR